MKTTKNVDKCLFSVMRVLGRGAGWEAWPSGRASGQRGRRDAWQTVRAELKQRGGCAAMRTLKDEAEEAENHFSEEEDEERFK